MSVSLVIFDLDGTLLNTIADLGTATNHALNVCGYSTHPISKYPDFVGNGVNNLIKRALPESARSESEIMRLKPHFIKYYDKHNIDNTRPYDGILSLLDALSKRNINMAIASNKYQSAVEKLSQHYFSHINWVATEGQKDIYPIKPDPSIVFDILSKCPTPLNNVLYVGDSGVDMQTAQRAGIKSVGVTWGFRPQSELEQNSATYIINNPIDILTLL